MNFYAPGSRQFNALLLIFKICKQYETIKIVLSEKYWHFERGRSRKL